MRVTLLVLAMVSLLAPGDCQSSSRLQQMMTNFASNVSNFAARISSGVYRTFNGREIPVRQRQHLARQQKQKQQLPISDPELDENNLIAPNALPQKPLSQQQQQVQGIRPLLRQNRNRLSFRQFVDGTMSRLANMLPRLRRRAFNRQRNTRDIQVRLPTDHAYYDHQESDFGVSSRSLQPSSHSNPTSIHVSVNLYGGDNDQPAGSSSPDHSLTVKHYSNHTLDVKHHSQHETKVRDNLVNVTKKVNASEDTTKFLDKTKDVSPPYLTAGVQPYYTYPNLNSFFNHYDASHWWPQDMWQTQQNSGSTFNSQDNSYGTLPSSTVNYPSPVSFSFNKDEESRWMLSKGGYSTSDYKDGYLHGYDQGYDDGRVRGSLDGNQWSSGNMNAPDSSLKEIYSVWGNPGVNNKKWGPETNNGRWNSGTNKGRGSPGTENNGRGQVSSGTDQVSWYANKVLDEGTRCGGQCLWDELMNFLDHYSTSESRGVMGASPAAGSVGHVVRSMNRHPNTQHNDHPAYISSHNLVYSHTPNINPNLPGMSNVNSASSRRRPGSHFNSPQLKAGGEPYSGDTRQYISVSRDQGNGKTLPPGPLRYRPNYDLIFDKGRRVRGREAGHESNPSSSSRRL
ncbi:uncharacterized protein [Cherax quadricarinatus]|uniref:uncharacterized protein n=1 Tax=Cherax quadricarinatus TaxID=27406 RepID=UPI00387E53A8